MNIAKIYNEIVKVYCAGKRIYVGEYEGFVGIAPNDYCIYLLAKTAIPFDVAKLLGNNRASNIAKLIPQKRERAQLVDELIQRERKIYRKVVGKSTEAWIEQKLLQNFDADATFEVATPKSLVLVYENEILVGIVVPLVENRS